MDSEFKTTSLGAVFSKWQLACICAIYTDAEGDLTLVCAGLKVYFNTISDHLATKGLLPDYAAYAVAYAICARAA